MEKLEGIGCSATLVCTLLTCMIHLNITSDEHECSAVENEEICREVQGILHKVHHCPKGNLVFARHGFENMH